jgi:WD40 repeat protein
MFLCPLQQAAPATKTLAARPLVTCDGPLRDLALASDGERVFTLTVPGQIGAWRAQDGASVWGFAKPGAWSVESAGESLLVVTMATPSALLVDPTSGGSGAVFAGPPNLVTHASAVAPSRGVWVGVREGLIQLAPDLEDGWSRVTLDNDGVTALALLENGARLAAGGQDGSVRFVAVPSGEVDHARALRGSASPVTALAATAKVLVVAAEDHSLRLWNSASGSIKANLVHSAPVRVLAAANESGLFACGDGEGSVLVWQIGRSAPLAHWKDDRFDTSVVALAFAPDEATLLVAAGARVLALDLAGLK